MLDNNISPQQVKKDLADSFNDRLNKLLDNVDEIRHKTVNEPELLMHLNERLNTLFLRLACKCKNEDIQEQVNLDDQIVSISKNLFSKKRVADNSGILVYQNNNIVREVKKLIDIREIHLWSIMEKLGLTNPPKKTTRRLN